MWPFDKPRTPDEASGLTRLEQQDLILKLSLLEARVNGMERAILELCNGIGYHLDRIDNNFATMDRNMHNLAAMTIRPPKDLLGGNQEPN